MKRTPAVLVASGLLGAILAAGVFAANTYLPKLALADVQPATSDKPKLLQVKVEKIEPPSVAEKVAKKTVAQRKAGASGPMRIWVLGDSTGQPISVGLSLLAAKDTRIKVRDMHLDSSGLTNMVKRNWVSFAKDELKHNPPDIAILCLGPNDMMDLTTENGAKAKIKSEDWSHEYAKRMNAFAKLFEDKGVRVYLNGQVFEPTHARLGAHLTAVNTALKESGKKLTNGEYLDTEAFFLDEKKVFKEKVEDANGKLMKTRSDGDKLHLTAAGGYVAAAGAWKKIVADFGL